MAELDLLTSMKRIRAVEERIALRYGEQKMRCPTHLSIGQEAVAAGVCAALTAADLAVSGHRAHAHYLAKGGSMRALVAELYGKVDGCCRGKGGSMHLTDRAAGFVGSTAIVGGTIPVGVGLALALKQQRSDAVSVVFLGDAATETGVFYESVNFAVLKTLPVLFVCENNLYSVYSPLSVRQPPGREIHRVAQALGLSAQSGDGNDALAVAGLASGAVSAIRNGAGPQFLEFSTYRWREHCGPNYDNDIGYRTEAEFEAWRACDPIPKLEALLDAVRIETLNAKVEQEVDDAFAFAEMSAFPPEFEAFTDLTSDVSGAAHG